MAQPKRTGTGARDCTWCDGGRFAPPYDRCAGCRRRAAGIGRVILPKESSYTDASERAAEHRTYRARAKTKTNREESPTHG